MPGTISNKTPAKFSGSRAKRSSGFGNIERSVFAIIVTWFLGLCALGHRRQFGPHNVGIDGCLADPGAEATIAGGDDVVTADEVGVAGDALRDQLRVLNEIRFRLDDPGNNDLALRQLDLLEQGLFMRVARVRGLERDRRRPRCERDINDLG